MIPKELRDRLGLAPGDVEVHAEGAGLRVEPVVGERLEERAGRLVVPATAARLTDEDIRKLRESDQR